MTLSDRVRIARRFQRSVRIDADLDDPKVLEGFICPRSSTDVLTTMARHVAETGQGAFTWTGPYGTGKSSLVVALSALLNGNQELRSKAAKLFGRDVASNLWRRLPLGAKGWRVLPVVGRRENPIRVLGEAIDESGMAGPKSRAAWTEKRLVETLLDVSKRSPKNYGGLVIFIDEMGKFLEGAAQEGNDIYVFQQLAEAASRSNKRLIIIGVLHQAFEEYAHRLSHQMRDEWSKIQGRFVDLAINAAGEEQIDLISRAIESSHKPSRAGAIAKTVARALRPERAADADHLAVTLETCWPLHPTVACLLGPISRRRFGQNQRSLFGFLNSAEPHGFQDFLRRASLNELYMPVRLWDYLRANLEPSILASPDGHRWALAAEAIERCEAQGDDALRVQLLKSIAVIDLFKERSGLTASMDVLRACFADESENRLKKALEQLGTQSFIIFKKYLNSFAIFAGSDFDVDQAVREAIENVAEIDFSALKQLAGLQPILAKRNYHETGAMRWFDLNLVPLSQLANAVRDFAGDNNTIGQFLLAIPTDGENQDEAAKICREAARHSDAWDTVVGLSARSWGIVELARELIALESVRNDRPELAGDAVARREVTARLAALQAQLETELHRTFDGATWFQKHHEPKTYRHAALNSVASELAQNRFPRSPHLHNELLNRHKPSVSAIAAQNLLLRLMVLREGEERLGIEGYPAEGGLFASMLQQSGLYTKSLSGYRFDAPKAENDPNRLLPLWVAAEKYMREHSGRTVSVKEIYDLWRQPPFGVKGGLMPVLVVAFILSQRDGVAVYREGIFRARFDDVDVDYLGKDPNDIQLRWMTLSDVSRKLLSGMADVVRVLDRDNTLVHLEPIDVARGLVTIHENLPTWSKRTTRLSANAARIRNLFKRAIDPNRFIFDDIPEIAGGESKASRDADLKRIVSNVREGLEELIDAYPSMLRRLRDMMLAELEVPNLSPQSMAELRDRAATVKNVAGDFRLDAFVDRIIAFDGSDEAMTGIASLAANKPPKDWSDPDVDRAAVEIADLAQKFIRTETFARVKGRPQKREALAVVVGLHGRPTPMLEEFAVADSDRVAVSELVERVSAAIEHADTGRRNIILAALAELSARYMQDAQDDQKATGKGRVAS
ncbi:ATP-binding protein [Rhodopseudomonas pseudopalustris]|uniref:ATP-binding protein n=1 Tax=Rhodopseudomonas pseudopalustris TaxID=1513892 RepID=UPI003F9A36CD